MSWVKNRHASRATNDHGARAGILSHSASLALWPKRNTRKVLGTAHASPSSHTSQASPINASPKYGTPTLAGCCTLCGARWVCACGTLERAEHMRTRSRAHTRTPCSSSVATSCRALCGGAVGEGRRPGARLAPRSRSSKHGARPAM